MGTSGPTNGSQIVRAWSDASAPTGQGERYLTADGTVWRPIATPLLDTGDDATSRSMGRVVGSTIKVAIR